MLTGGRARQKAVSADESAVSSSSGAKRSSGTAKRKPGPAPPPTAPAKKARPPPTPTLGRLPKDLQLKVLKYLPWEFHFKTLSRGNKHFNAMCKLRQASFARVMSKLSTEISPDRGSSKCAAKGAAFRPHLPPTERPPIHLMWKRQRSSISGSHRQGPMSHLMTDGEWDNFWFSLDSMPWAAQQPAHCASPRRAVTDAEALVVAILSHGCDGDAALNGGGAKGAFGGRNRTVRSNRCGACAGCKAQDCGVCKNCRDKPRCARGRR